MKFIKTAIATTALFALSTTPALASLWKSPSGQTTVYMEGRGRGNVDFYYSAKLGATRITGKAEPLAEGDFFSGTFTEKLSNGATCTGRFDAYYMDRGNPQVTGYFDAVWEIRGGRNCPVAFGDSVEVRLNLGDDSSTYTAMLHDPQNQPLERLNLRATPNGRLIGYGLSGDIVYISPESLRGAYDGWYKVTFQDSGATGFMHSSLVRYRH